MAVSVKTGPVVGTPPTLEWIALDQLTVDETYQRDVSSTRSRGLIVGMTRRWDWRLCQPLAVVRRDDGTLAVVDGQHRLLGARSRDDVPHLPCVVTRQASVAEEADMFVELNTRRRQLSQHEIFTAALASQDGDALRVQQLVADAGLSFVRHNNCASWKPGQIHCGPMLMRAVKNYGEAVLRNALTALAEAHKGQILSSSATLLKGLFLVYSDDAKRPGFDPDLFIEGLASYPHAMWPDEARRVNREQPGLTRMDALAAAMIEAMDALRSQAVAA